MVISKMLPIGNGKVKFNLNIGGFCVRGVTWDTASNRITFPKRRTKGGRWERVVRTYGRQVAALQSLLISGQMRSKRDRRPCVLRPHNLRQRGYEYKFDFTVRGWVICNNRWNPDKNHVMLANTYLGPSGKAGTTKRVVSAYGPHINKLTIALTAARTRMEAGRR